MKWIRPRKSTRRMVVNFDSQVQGPMILSHKVGISRRVYRYLLIPKISHLPFKVALLLTEGLLKTEMLTIIIHTGLLIWLVRFTIS